MNYFGNGPKTEATGRLRQMAADVVALLLEVDFGGALLVAPSRPDGGTHRQEAAFGIFGALPTCQLMDDSGNYRLDVRPRAPYWHQPSLYLSPSR